MGESPSPKGCSKASTEMLTPACDGLQCLLPFCNAPLIAWTLESLAASNVKNTFIVIREGAQELQEWLEYAQTSSLHRLNAPMLTILPALEFPCKVNRPFQGRQRT